MCQGDKSANDPLALKGELLLSGLEAALPGAAPQDRRLMGYQGHMEKQEPSQLLPLSQKEQLCHGNCAMNSAVFSTSYFEYIFLGVGLKPKNFFPIPTLLRINKIELLQQSQIPFSLYSDSPLKSLLNFFFEYLTLHFKTVQTRAVREGKCGWHENNHKVVQTSYTIRISFFFKPDFCV